VPPPRRWTRSTQIVQSLEARIDKDLTSAADSERAAVELHTRILAGEEKAEAAVGEVQGRHEALAEARRSTSGIAMVSEERQKVCASRAAAMSWCKRP